MLDPVGFVAELKSNGFAFFTGVPDSLLKEFCACVTDQFAAKQHIIAPNEGASIGLATGYHLATGKPGLVYMQNSGTGNALNPLLSLADTDVYSIPMLILIGWRGAPGTKDEPQHVKQGKVQEDLLEAIGYPYEILEQDFGNARRQLQRLALKMNQASTPVVLLVPRGSFSKYASENSDARARIKDTEAGLMSREEAIELILGAVSETTRFVSTTGMASREIFEIRERRNQGHQRDFLTVGSMGHAGMIALGLAGFQDSPMVCIDGDGAALMHMGALPLIGHHAPPTFMHIVLNNGAHDSVGGQPTLGRQISFAQIAKCCGYKTVQSVDTPSALLGGIESQTNGHGPHFIEVLIKKGARANLGRPTTTPVENKKAFMGQQ